MKHHFACAASVDALSVFMRNSYTTLKRQSFFIWKMILGMGVMVIFSELRF